MAETDPIRGLGGKIPVESEKPAGLGQPSTFESYMQGTAGQPKGSPPAGVQPGNVQGASPMELAKPAMQTGGPTFNTLLAQAKAAQDGLGTIGTQLNEPALKLKRSQSQLLKHKLQDANGHIRSAGNKLGVPPPSEKKLSDSSSPAARFLGMIGQGQDDLYSVQNQLKVMSQHPDQLTPGDFMFIQVKMSQAQQEIEYSSTLLGKIVDSIKQVLNTQL